MKRKRKKDKKVIIEFLFCFEEAKLATQIDVGENRTLRRGYSKILNRHHQANPNGFNWKYKWT